MKAVVAALLTLSLAGCFPNSAKHRTYAKIGEGAALASGVAILYVANSGADCDQSRSVGMDSSCRSNASVIGTVGLGLIIAGFTGFIATISTEPDAKPEALQPLAVEPSADDSKPAPAARTAEKAVSK